jgi:N-acetylglucosaminyldiphosphoundecaprenol N-acetyl-beta-D-mannosaminyltransferase
LDETIAAADQAIERRLTLHHVCINVAKFVAMRSDAELDRDVRASHLVSVDGMGILWGARIIGVRVPERVAGIDLMEGVFALCAKKGYRPYLLGAKDEVLQQAMAKARSRWPGLQIAGSHHGYFAEAEERTIVAAIRASHADCLFIGMPTPRKERFMARHRDALAVPFIMGVGGAFDVLAGKVQRAPRLVQAIGMEWLFRTLQEPKRLAPRYITSNAAFAVIMAKAMMTKLF